jgi:hypothetical protein
MTSPKNGAIQTKSKLLLQNFAQKFLTARALTLGIK